MDTKNKSSTGNMSKTDTKGSGIFTASVLAYCGYKMVNNKLQETKYEANPYKNVQTKK